MQTLNRNYAVYKYQEGNANYLQPTFQLYQDHLQRGFLYQEEQIALGTFSNMVLIGLRNKAYAWVHDFLLQHQNRIKGAADPEAAFQYNLGQYYFHTQQYDQALDCIAATYEDQFYKLAARRLEIKIYYETQSEIFEARLNAFKLFLYRLESKNVNFKNKEGNQTFIDLLKQIMHPKTYQNQRRIDKLLRKAQEIHFLADKEWIIEKLEALR